MRAPRPLHALAVCLTGLTGLACVASTASTSEAGSSEGTGDTGTVESTRACDPQGRCWRVEEVESPPDFGADLYWPSFVEMDGALRLVAKTATELVFVDPLTGERLDSRPFGDFELVGLNFIEPNAGVWAQGGPDNESALVFFPYANGLIEAPIVQELPAPITGMGLAYPAEPLAGSIAWIESSSPPQLVLAQGEPGALTELRRLELPQGSGYAKIRFGDFDKDSRPDLALFNFTTAGPPIEDGLFVLDVEGAADIVPLGPWARASDLWRPSPVNELTRVYATQLERLVYDPTDYTFFETIFEFPQRPSEMIPAHDATQALAPDGSLWVIGREHGVNVDNGFFPWTRQPWVQRVTTDNTLAFENILALRTPCLPDDEVDVPKIITAAAGAISAPGRDELLVWEETCEEGGRLWAVVED